jgi:hypothetical protein
MGDLPEPELIEIETEAINSDAVAFLNRAIESEPILGFLYFYRVLEACFDNVLTARIASWRLDASTDELSLLKRVRKLTQKEDTWPLRQVLGVIVDQALLDQSAADGLLESDDVQGLVAAICARRNRIAHGRRSQHGQVLVPYSVSGAEGRPIGLWYQLMRRLAEKALAKWVFAG